jgi:hypothetical protein
MQLKTVARLVECAILFPFEIVYISLAGKWSSAAHSHKVAKMANLLKTSWSDIDPGEIRCILFERIGKPGQYRDVANNPGKFYLPLADGTCRVELTFSEDNQLVAIEPGPAFDAVQWDDIVRDMESLGPIKVGRDCSFSSYRVKGSWLGSRSGVQILPPPADAPVAPCEMAEHPFILEFPVKASDRWPITNHRRMKLHRQLTLLLNILLSGRTCLQSHRSRHFWAIDPNENSFQTKWVQEFFFANFGNALSDDLSPASSERINEVEPDAYYARFGHDGRGLEVPNDLDESICCYTQLSAGNRKTFDRASFWMDMASRQWDISSSAAFASLVIAIEALGDRNKRPTARFHDYLEQYAPGASLQDRRKKMYALRSDILHGSGLMQMDLGTHFGWSPPEQHDDELTRELWPLTKLSMRNWLKNPPT